MSIEGDSSNNESTLIVLLEQILGELNNIRTIFESEFDIYIDDNEQD